MVLMAQCQLTYLTFTKGSRLVNTFWRIGLCVDWHMRSSILLRLVCQSWRRRWSLSSGRWWTLTWWWRMIRWQKFGIRWARKTIWRGGRDGDWKYGGGGDGAIEWWRCGGDVWRRGDMMKDICGKLDDSWCCDGVMWCDMKILCYLISNLSVRLPPNQKFPLCLHCIEPSTKLFTWWWCYDGVTMQSK